MYKKLGVKILCPHGNYGGSTENDADSDGKWLTYK
jgi:hypothetical protein